MTVSAPAGSGDYGLLGRLIGNSREVYDRLQTLTAQAGSGRIADAFSGLAAGGMTSLTVAPALARQQAWVGNINAASARMQVAQTALSAISDIASSFYASTSTLNGLNPGNVDSLAAGARDALRQVAGLLDARDGDVYVFAGQDSATPPVPDPDGIISSSYMGQIQAAVGALAGSGAAATLTATMATATSNAAGTSPFSAQVSGTGAALRPTVQVGEGQFVATGIVAGTNGDVASTGASTSGSYIRDIMRGLATLGSLTSGQIGAGGFAALVADTRAALGGAIGALNADAGVMGDRQTRMQTDKTTMASVTIALQSQMSAATDVDMATTLSQMSRVQTQLQASYQLIASIQSLSLVKYLS